MKFNLIYLLILLLTFFTANTHAKSYIRDYTYKASDADSKITSRTNALDQVKLILLQEIGTHIRQQINITKDGKGNTYASEDVEAITAGLTKVEIIEEKWNGVTYYLKAKIDADTKQVLDALADIKKEKSSVNQQLELLRENQLKLKESREEIIRLRQQLAQASNEEKEKLVIEYNDNVKQLSLADMVEKGHQLYSQGQYIDSVYWNKKAAEQGFAAAQYNLGVAYHLGQGVKQDFTVAAKWYRQAAEQEYEAAKINLALLYHKGAGVEQNDIIAAELYREAAEAGWLIAQFRLANSYRKGKGVEQDLVKAATWYRKAAQKGFAKAQYNLGTMYRKGHGVKKDYEIAKDWYQKAADQGYKKAIRGLELARKEAEKENGPR